MRKRCDGTVVGALIFAVGPSAFALCGNAFCRSSVGPLVHSEQGAVPTVADTSPISKVLVATDGSDASWAGLRFGADLAAFADAPLVVVHVLLQGPVPRSIAEEAGLDVASGRYTRAGDAIGSTWFFPQPMNEDDLKTIGRTLLDKATAIARERGAENVDCQLKDGMISETLLSVLHDQRPDLAVLGRHGLGQAAPGRRRRRQIGGVSRRVVTEAHCPTTLLSA